MVGEKQCSRCLAGCPLNANFCARCGQALTAPVAWKQMHRHGGFGWLVFLIAFIAFIRFYAVAAVVWHDRRILPPDPPPAPRSVDPNFFQPVHAPPPPPPPPGYGTGYR
jgi:hypothetical protein